jgi:D-alanyl-D-alanine carboxypeptidase
MWRRKALTLAMPRRLRNCCLASILAVVLAGGLLFVWALLALQPKAAPDFPPELQPALDLAVKHYGLPAMSVAIVHSDRVETAVSGVRSLGSPGKVQSGDLWHLGSNTKAMTATMLALLVAEGKLDWETTPVQVWPDWELQSQFQTVTLRQLLEHRAGIPPYTASTEVDKLPELTGSATAQRRGFVQYILKRKPARRTGQYLYSNAGYSVATAMAEQVTGQSYEALMTQYVLEPLALQGHFGWPVEESSAQPRGHYPDGLTYTPHDITDEYEVPGYLDPAGGLSLNLGDYARFVQAHLRGLQGKQPANGKAWPLTAAMVHDLHRAAAHPRDDECYSCGWIEEVEMAGAACCTHDGSLGTFYATTYIQPARDIAVVVLANAGDDRAVAATHAVVEAVLDDAAPDSN